MNKVFKKILGVFAFVMIGLFMINNVGALDLEEIANQVAPNNTVKFNAIRPDDGMELDFFTQVYVDEFNNLYGNDNVYIGIENYNDDFSTATLSINNHDGNGGYIDSYEKTINIEWVKADEKINKKIDKYIEQLAKIKDKELNGSSRVYYFDLTDLSLINYFVTANTKNLNNEVVARTLAYSDTVRKIFKSSNLSYQIDFRAGSIYANFENKAFGGFLVKYNGTIYGYQEPVGIAVKEILYVPSNTELTDEALIKAAEKRIKEYMPNSNIKISNGPLLNNYTNDEGIVDFNEIIDVTKTGDKTYVFDFGDFSIDFLIVADSSKMTTPEFLSTDINTDIQVSSNSSSIPLDTNVSANKLTSGEEYNRIVKILKSDKNEIFDIKLHSLTLDKFVTKLDDGTFEVKIPLNDNFKNKDLVVYYIDDNDKIVEYKVTVKDGYAIFNTDHFSVYTLTEKEQVENPNTFDGIGNFIIIGFISLIGILTLVICLKNKIRAN